MKRKRSNGKRLGCTSAILVAIIVISVFTVGVVPVSAQFASVTRDLPVVVALDEEFDVTLTQTGFFMGIGTVIETLPDDFGYVAGSYTGSGDVTWNPGTRELTLGFREDNAVTYRVTASSFDQLAVFAGTYSTFIWIDGGVYEEGDVSGDTEVGVDGTDPYTDGHSPAKGATGVPVDTNVVVHVKDNFAVDPNSIKMGVDLVDVTSQLSLVPLGLGDWLVTYNPSGNLTYNHLYTITLDASDKAGHTMTQDLYTFRTEQAPVPDEEPPEITNVGSSSITTTTATITWDTDEVSDSLVKYGTTSGGPYTEQEYNAADVMSHNIGLTGLAPNTPYYYVVNSTDPSGNSAESGENDFTTLAAPDEEPPEISNIASPFVNTNSATITWDTDEVSDSLVKYGTTQGGPYTDQEYNAADVTSHSIGLTGLAPNTTYYYVVNSTDPSDNSAESGENDFTTLTEAAYCFTIDFVTGYNMITMPLDDPSVMTALSLINKIGGDAKEVFKWNSATQTWVSYNPSMPPPAAFNIVGGEGYLVRMDGSASVEFCGDGWTSPFDMSLVTGYNMMGMPVNDTSVTNASALLTKIGGDAKEIFKWNKGTQSWVSYNPLMPPQAAFDIEGGEGYFVRMSGDANVAFTGEPWQN